MANPINFEGANAVMRAPPGAKDCVDLHVQRTDWGFVSIWHPTTEELLKLAGGGCIALSIIGPTHPSVAVNVVHMDVVEAPCQNPR